jgi:hypothetical protein
MNTGSPVLYLRPSQLRLFFGFRLPRLCFCVSQKICAYAYEAQQNGLL